MKAKIDAIKKFLSWCFTKTVWHKIIWLIILLTLCVVVIFKDWDIKTRHGGCKTDTKLDADKVIDKVKPSDKPQVPPSDFPAHR